MIKFYKATRPSRRRDRGRFILQVGRYLFHLTRDEATRLTRHMDNELLRTRHRAGR